MKTEISNFWVNYSFTQSHTVPQPLYCIHAAVTRGLSQLLKYFTINLCHSNKVIGVIFNSFVYNLKCHSSSFGLYAHSLFLPECWNVIAKCCGQEYRHVVFCICAHCQLWRARVQACNVLFIFSYYTLLKLEFFFLFVLAMQLLPFFHSRYISLLELCCKSNWSFLIYVGSSVSIMGC